MDDVGTERLHYGLALLRPHLYGLGYPRKPCPQVREVTLAEGTFHLFLCKTQATVYKRIANPSRGTRTTRVERVVSPRSVTVEGAREGEGCTAINFRWVCAAKGLKPMKQTEFFTYLRPKSRK